MTSHMAVPVAHIITKLELGGAQQNTLFTVANLDPGRFRRILVTGEPGLLDPEARAIPETQFHQIPTLVRPIRPLADARALVALTRLLLKLRPAIVHTHSSKAGILGRWAARLAGVPILIHSIHGFGFTRYQHPVVRAALLAMERSAARFTTRFFAVSEANRQLGIDLGVFPPERATVLRSGIDVEACRNVRVDRDAKRRELGCRPGGPLVGMVAPLKPQKAPVDFVRMAGLIHHRYPDAQFVLVGDGELRPAVEAEITSLGLSSVFHLVGWRRDVPEILHCLDVFVLTSLWEGLPRVCLEALSSGIPVVCTSVDGTPEVVRDGINGFLLAAGDVRAMAKRVVDLLSEPDRARAMGAAGTALPAQFDIREMVRQQEREYLSLLDGREEWKFLRESSRYGTPSGS